MNSPVEVLHRVLLPVTVYSILVYCIQSSDTPEVAPRNAGKFCGPLTGGYPAGGLQGRLGNIGRGLLGMFAEMWPDFALELTAGRTRSAREAARRSPHKQDRPQLRLRRYLVGEAGGCVTQHGHLSCNECFPGIRFLQTNKIPTEEPNKITTQRQNK